MSYDSRSDYEVTCICGQKTRSNMVEFTCSKCGRQIEMQWRAEYRPSHNPHTMEESTS